MIRNLASAAVLACWALASANAQPKPLPMEPQHDSGQSVTGAFEGWFQNPDGTYSLLLGYFNRNLTEELDIPIGPNNRIEPGGPDCGQPTHFLTRRQWGVFTVTVPKDFGDRKLTWTLVANRQTMAIPASLNPLWELSPFHEEGMGNTPPTLAFAEAGPSVQGPRAIPTLLEATLANPLPLTLWVADDAKTLAGMLDRDPSLLSRHFADMPYGNIDLRGATLTHLAVEFGEIECLDVLLDQGANINLAAEVIDGVGGQTPIFHAIATNQGANIRILEHLVQRVAQQINLSVRATFRLFGEVQAVPVTPLEYAERAAGLEVPDWRRASEREIALLKSLAH